MNNQASYGIERNKRSTAYALAAAFMLVSMLVLQLFNYEDFAVVLSSILPTNDSRMLMVLAGYVVLAELFALPYLLSMYLSKLMRVVSAIIGFCIAGFWLFASFTNAHANNSGLFSTTVELPGGIPAAVWSVILFSLVCKVIFADTRFRHATS